MEEIKVGEWVRTTGGHIRKVSKIMPCYENDLLLSDTYYIEFDEKGDIGTYKSNQAKEFITKHSFNLIDLLEEGDYVNGYKVISIDRNVPDIHTDCIELDLNNNYEYNFITIHQIKSIVTKEMMKSIEYIVGESNG